MDSKFLAPKIMLGFGLLFGAVGAREYTRLRANPAPLMVPCDASAIEGIPVDRWIVVESCEPLLDDIFEVTEGNGEVDELLVPLRAPGGAANDAPVAVLVVRGTDLLNAYEDLSDAEESDAQVAEAAESFMTKLDVERVEGMTASYYGEAGDSRFALLRQRYNLAESGVVSIERGSIPTRSTMIVAFAAALILLPLGLVFLVRARKLPSAQHAPLPPGLPR